MVTCYVVYSKDDTHALHYIFPHRHTWRHELIAQGVKDTKNCSTSLNTWRFMVDSQMFGPDEYLVSVSSIDDNLNQNHQYTSNHTTFYILESPE